jgi:hypothetical protein
MVSALSNLDIDENPPKKLNIGAEVVAGKQLSDLVTNKTLKLFEALDIQTNFLRTDQTTWDTNTEFINGNKKVQSLKVVNDLAERGISLISSFNAVLTNQEEQK